MGLKENVIVGKRIPAGTGMRKYDRLELVTEQPGGGEGRRRRHDDLMEDDD